MAIYDFDATVLRLLGIDHSRFTLRTRGWTTARRGQASEGDRRDYGIGQRNVMNVVQSDEFEVMAVSYQCLEIARLNEVLKNHGIADARVREAICKEYAFDSGNFLDQGWFKADGKTL